MINYSELYKKQSNEFIEGCHKLSTDDLMRVGKPLHIIACNEWNYEGELCYSVKFSEFVNYYWNCTTLVGDFIGQIIRHCGGIEQANDELRNNALAIKLYKYKTKRGFTAVGFDIVDE